MKISKNMTLLTKTSVHQLPGKAPAENRHDIKLKKEKRRTKNECRNIGWKLNPRKQTVEITWCRAGCSGTQKICNL